jgi:hypothetical protein
MLKEYMSPYMLKQPWHLTSCTKEHKDNAWLDARTPIKRNDNRHIYICCKSNAIWCEHTYHEEGVGGLDEALLLVLLLLELRRRVEQIDVVLEHLLRRFTNRTKSEENQVTRHSRTISDQTSKKVLKGTESKTKGKESKIGSPYHLDERRSWEFERRGGQRTGWRRGGGEELGLKRCSGRRGAGRFICWFDGSEPSVVVRVRSGPFVDLARHFLAPLS